MRIAWFTPLREASPLSGYSIAMCEALAESCEIELHALDRSPWRQTMLAVRSAGPGAAVAEDVLRIYAVGGEPSSRELYARGTTWVSGVCVLHDPVEMSFLANSELVLHALGIVVHSEGQRTRIEQQWFGPVGRIHEPVAGRPDTTRRAAAELLAFLDEAAAWRPGLALVDRVAAELRTMGLNGSSPAVGSIAREVATLVAP
jgi:hypothetical protein